MQPILVLVQVLFYYTSPRGERFAIARILIFAKLDVFLLQTGMCVSKNKI